MKDRRLEQTVYMVLIVLILVVTPIIGLNAKGQELATYTNSKYGFNIHYPLNWIYHEYDYSGEIGKAVGSALKDTIHVLPIVVFCPQISETECNSFQNSSFSISVFDKLKKSDRTLEKVLQMPELRPNNIISSESTNISGIAAQKIVYTNQLFNRQIKHIEFILVKDDKAYEILYTPTGYTATEQSSTLPSEVQKIVNSLQFS